MSNLFDFDVILDKKNILLLKKIRTNNYNSKKKGYFDNF